MDRTTQEEVSQQVAAGSDNSDRNLAAVEIAAELTSEGEALSTEGVPDVHQIASNFKENVTGVGMVDVGSLDSGKHTAVAFFKNKTPMFSNSPLALVGALNSGKGLKIKGINSKLNKSLHGGNVCFKHASHHRVSLKKSMEQLAESISTITKGNIDDGGYSRNDEQIEGFITPRQKFIRAFSEYYSEHGLDIVCLVKLRDLGFSGPAFTWQRGNTYIRLDRALANDEWMDILQSKPVEFFERLYGETPPSSLKGIPSFDFPKLSSPEVAFLESDITNEEIKRALFDMAPLKAPGSDRFFGTECPLDSGLSWPCLFGLIAWRIWKNRNLFIFQKLSWSVAEVIKNSRCWARQYETRMGINKRVQQRSASTTSLDTFWTFLSTDGAVVRDSGYAAIGGVARDFPVF
ncbi:hypothetical protein PVK06_027474 [Gossypium arboreum]|uniref:Uncharacterized protein n=1 Tax=Gossypium arboreum TaxID=29729 RepID=A0ABR0P0C7_GOSAR|nr:hypothetical protein PVK06_027474 [Gossypium arboreum]